jgi:hypothetical protein
MSDSKQITFDDDDYEVTQPAEKGKQTIFWLALGIGGAVCLVILGLVFVAARRERTQMMMAEAQAAQAEAKEAQRRAFSAPLPMPRPPLPEPPAGPTDEGAKNWISGQIIGSRLEPMAKGGDWYWSFTKERFVLVSEKELLPPDLKRAFLEKDQKASHIKGKWRLEDDNQTLVFSDVLIDGKERPGEVKLGIERAEGSRLIIGSHQYLITEQRR